MKKWYRLAIGLILFLLVMVTGCSTQSEEDGFSLSSAGSTEFFVEPDIGVVGKVDVLNKVSLSFPVDGLLEELKVSEGDRVTAGQELAILDITNLENEILRAQAAVTVAEANYERAQAAVHESLIREAQVRVEAASAGRVFGAAQETAQALAVEAARAQLDYLNALPFEEDVAVARAQYDEAVINLENIKGQFANTKLVAPIEGTVIGVLAHEGEYVFRGEVILLLGDFSQLVVEAYANDAEIVGVDIGDRAGITLLALPDIQLFAKVISIMPNTVEPDKGSFIVRLQLAEPVERSYWGMSAEVLLEK
jgi:HlyD family secretion protein